MDKVKFPRTPHLPWSPGVSGDDIVASKQRTDVLLAAPVVVTEKLDGENTSVGKDFVYARAIVGRKSESLGFARTVAARFQLQIPQNTVLVFENLYAVHSIAYEWEPMLALIAVYEMRNGQPFVLAWDDVLEWGNRIGQMVAPVLYEGIATPADLKACFTGTSRLGGEQEGYVVRTQQAFPLADYAANVFKWVRPNHVASNAKHWSTQAITRQGKMQ